MNNKQLRLQINCDICETPNCFFLHEHPRTCESCREWLINNDTRIKNIVRLARIFDNEIKGVKENNRGK